MRGNSFGKMISITSFGESHGVALGVIVDGIPPNLDVDLNLLQKRLDERAPGKLSGTSPRGERDQVQILSGVFEGKTLGTPIAAVVFNHDARSSDYKSNATPRPGHADRTTLLKYGIADYRGGGRSSGRETLARVIGGYFASLVLPEVKVLGYASSIGVMNFEQPDLIGPYGVSPSDQDKLIKYLLTVQEDADSVGGTVKLVVKNPPVGLGEPAFDKLKADIGKAILSIGAVTSFSFGAGENFARESGKKMSSQKNIFGGLEGGISNGEPLIFSFTVKPTSTVGDKARAGRHDPCIVPRIIPVAKAMLQLVLADHYLRQLAYEQFKK